MLSFHSLIRMLFRSGLVCFALLFALANVLAQEKNDDQMEQPTYLTMRVFEVRVPVKKEPLTNQVFRLRTAAQTDDETWLRNIKKAYPSATEVSLLRTAQFRLFMRPRPGTIILGTPGNSHIAVNLMIAQGLRDDDTINTTAISEVNLNPPGKRANPIPMSMTNNGFEIESGMTYFYTSEGVRLRSDMYAAYVRDGNSPANFTDFDPYLVIAVSYEPGKHTPLTFDATRSLALQGKARTKIDPKWSEVITKQGLFGTIQVRVELNAEGKVAAANLWSSTLPEGNLTALEAAKQWEFSASDLAGINAPISALLTFAIAPPAPPAKDANAPEKKTQEASPTTATANPAASAKPATTKPIAKKPPIKRSNK